MIADRRRVLHGLVSIFGLTLARKRSYAAGAIPLLAGQPLPARQEGELDIHHIDTGRGNCTLVVAPDGTAIMIDAGASNAALETSGSEHPDAARRLGEWQARYALHHTASEILDYLIVTHLHPDHIGDVGPQTPASSAGPFRLTGVTDVDHLMPVRTHLDRGFPNYDLFPPAPSPYVDNYLSYLRNRRNNGRAVGQIQVGSNSQVVLREPHRYPTFQIRALAANSIVWDGEGKPNRTVLRNLPSFAAEDRPGENPLSVALRLTYGRFSYFTGGDLASDTHDGLLPWMDIETPVSRIAGRTEVATANHHGYFDACGPDFVRNLDAQAYIIQGWDVGHPGTAQMQRLLGAWSNVAEHDVFATDLLPANELINRRFTGLLKSRHGHVVVRVANGGSSYRIAVLDSSMENGPVTSVHGPYICRV